jgi:uncharacterized membrane protein
MDESFPTSASAQPQPAYRLWIALFDDEGGAGRALAQVLAARREKKVAVPAVAEVRRDAAGAVAINEPGDISAKEGAVAGGLVGGVLGGLLGRRMLAGAVVGAALGALGAEKHDAGIPNPRLHEIGAGLPYGSSALVAIVPEDAANGLQTLLGVEGGRVTSEPIALDLDVMRQLSAGQYREAADSLATHAESLVADTKARLTEAAGAFGRSTASGTPVAQPAEAGADAAAAEAPRGEA